LRCAGSSLPQVAKLEEIRDGREGQKESKNKQNKSEDRHAAEGDGLPAPAHFKNDPGDKPDEKGDGGNAGERTCGLVEGKRTFEGRGLVCRDGEDGESEAGDTRGEDGRRAGAVGE